MVREITKIRMFPKAYAKYLRALGTHFEGTLWRLREHVPIRTTEGRAAVVEATEFLERVQRRKPQPSTPSWSGSSPSPARWRSPKACTPRPGST